MDSNPDSDSSVHGTEAAPFRSSSTTSASPNHNGPQYERAPEQKSLDDEPIMIVSIGIGAVAIARGGKVFKVSEHVGGATSYAIRQYRH